MSILFASLIAGTTLIACVLSWWLGKCGADNRIKALEAKLHTAANDLAAERLKGRAAEEEASELRRQWPKEIGKPKRKRDSHGRFSRR